MELDRAAALERLVHPYKYVKSDNWPLTPQQAKILDEHRADEEAGIHHHKKESEELDLTGYTKREKLFFSGLLIFEMYHTIRKVENLYFQSDSIPEPKEKIRLNQIRRGFGVDSFGMKSTLSINGHYYFKIVTSRHEMNRVLFSCRDWICRMGSTLAPTS